VAEAFADDLDGHAGGDEQAGVGVAHVVEADDPYAGSAGDPLEGLGDGVRVDGGTVAVGERHWRTR
jgi:hypothetical protein